jgi:hypothetical protein
MIKMRQKYTFRLPVVLYGTNDGYAKGRQQFERGLIINGHTEYLNPIERQLKKIHYDWAIVYIF